MTISEKEHFYALRASDQRAVELLARANNAKNNYIVAVISIIIALMSVLVAITAIIKK